MSAELNVLPEEIRALGRKAIVAVGDVFDDAVVSAAVDAAIQTFGKINILFHNTGICAYAEVGTMTDDEWNARTGIHLKRPFKVTRRVSVYMKVAKSGGINNNPSVMGVLDGCTQRAHRRGRHHAPKQKRKAFGSEVRTQEI